jgi:hypothetical protein
MIVDKRWRKLGWRHPLWDYVRFYTSFRKRTKQREEWLAKLRASVFEVEPGNYSRPENGLDPDPAPAEPRERGIDGNIAAPGASVVLRSCWLPRAGGPRRDSARSLWCVPASPPLGSGQSPPIPATLPGLATKYDV